MSRYSLAPSFLRDFAVLEADLSAAETQALDRLLAEVVANPLRVRRVQSFYDPTRSSWLTRSDPFVLHYAYDHQADEVILLNLFRRR